MSIKRAPYFSQKSPVFNQKSSISLYFCQTSPIFLHRKPCVSMFLYPDRTDGICLCHTMGATIGRFDDTSPWLSCKRVQFYQKSLRGLTKESYVSIFGGTMIQVHGSLAKEPNSFKSALHVYQKSLHVYQKSLHVYQKSRTCLSLEAR